MNAVSYIDREEALAEAKQYYESIGKEFDAKSQEIVLAIHEVTASAYRRGYTDGIKAVQTNNKSQEIPRRGNRRFPLTQKEQE